MRRSLVAASVTALLLTACQSVTDAPDEVAEPVTDVPCTPTTDGIEEAPEAGLDRSFQIGRAHV